MKTTEEILENVEFEPVSRFQSHGNEIQICKFSYKELDVYERTFIPYNILKHIVTTYSIDLILPIGENVPQGYYSEEGYGYPEFKEIEDAIKWIDNYKK